MTDEKQIEITSELFEAAQAAESAEDIAAIAHQNGAEMSAEEAEAAWQLLHGTDGEIADEELDNVAGGACGSDQRTCPSCGDANPKTIKKARSFSGGGVSTTLMLECRVCHTTWQRSYRLD